MPQIGRENDNNFLFLFLVRVHFTGKKIKLESWFDYIQSIEHQNCLCTLTQYLTPSGNLECFESGKGYWWYIFLRMLEVA